MKKIINILVCVTCISVTAIAQSVRIGNLEFNVRKVENDTVAQITVHEPCPPCPDNLAENSNQPKPKPKFKQYEQTSFFGGFGAVLPNESSDYYTVLGGSSFNIDAGWIRCHMLTRWFALGGTLQYSFYNYKLRDAASDPKFVEEIIGAEFAKDDIRLQAYRSHNITTSAFTRFYLTPLQTRNGRIISGSGKLYLDLGAQGDFAASRYCMLKTQSEKKRRYREDYAFNPFGASAIVRIGCNLLPGSKSAIFARYRFTDAFNSKVLPMDLPPLTIGIQFF